jgi:hypothetical protein
LQTDVTELGKAECRAECIRPQAPAWPVPPPPAARTAMAAAPAAFPPHSPA